MSTIVYKQRFCIIITILVVSGILFGSDSVRGEGCISPPSNLVSWWSGDNDALDMMGMNNGTLMNGAIYGTGMVGQAFSFTGAVDSFVDIPDSPSLNPAGAFSVDGWFYIDPSAPGVAGQLNTLVSKGDGYPPNGGWDMSFDDRPGLPFGPRALYFLVNGSDGGYLELTQNNSITTAGWYHVAATFDPSVMPQAKLYLDGIVVADSGGGTVPSMKTNAMTMRIGAMHWTEDFGAGSDRMKGMADEVHFFNRALSVLEIAAIYNAGSAGICPVTEPFFPFRQGWDFISFPKTPPADVPTALTDVYSHVVVVWGWDNQNRAWKRWRPSGGISNTLTSLETGKGYWTNMDASGSVNMGGWASPPSTIVPLSEGWNLVGYQGSKGTAVDQALSGIAGRWSVIWGWQNGQWYAKHATIPNLPVPPLTNLYRGKAYWIKVKPGQATGWNQ
jgi:hypothetical protein